jgi:hypothetical protein
VGREQQSRMASGRLLRFSVFVSVGGVAMLGCASPAKAIDGLLREGAIPLESLTATACKEVATITDTKRLDEIDKKFADRIEKSKANLVRAQKDVTASKEALDSAVKAYTDLKKLSDYSAARLKGSNVPGVIATQLIQDNQKLAANANAIVEAQQKLNKARVDVIEATGDVTIQIRSSIKVVDCITKRREELTKQIGTSGPAEGACLPSALGQQVAGSDGGYSAKWSFTVVAKAECAFAYPIPRGSGAKLVQPQHGTVEVREKPDNLSHNVFYRPAPGFHGKDSFRYTNTMINTPGTKSDGKPYQLDVTVEVKESLN